MSEGAVIAALLAALSSEPTWVALKPGEPGQVLVSCPPDSRPVWVWASPTAEAIKEACSKRRLDE